MKKWMGNKNFKKGGMLGKGVGALKSGELWPSYELYF